MSNIIKEDIDTVIFMLEVILRSSKEGAIIHVNSDALVVEYNDRFTGNKKFDIVASIV
tara:strand:- start:1208 stop:1381 length:174 start_codon:yes stop_codon:yes gene_type:complete